MNGIITIWGPKIVAVGNAVKLTYFYTFFTAPINYCVLWCFWLTSQ